jgi:hypothetical protein
MGSRVLWRCCNLSTNHALVAVVTTVVGSAIVTRAVRTTIAIVPRPRAITMAITIARLTVAVVAIAIVAATVNGGRLFSGNFSK